MRKMKKIVTGIAVATLLLGSMLTVNAATSGWVQSGNTWSYVNANGTKATGWLQDGNTWYYLDGNGVMKTGWQQVSGKWYYLSSNGAMKTGWLQEGSTWYYLNSDGSMKTGWLQEGNKWYYLNANGSMAVNTTIDNCYVGADGSALYGGEDIAKVGTPSMLLALDGFKNSEGHWMDLSCYNKVVTAVASKI